MCHLSVTGGAEEATPTEAYHTLESSGRFLSGQYEALQPEERECRSNAAEKGSISVETTVNGAGAPSATVVLADRTTNLGNPFVMGRGRPGGRRSRRSEEEARRGAVCWAFEELVKTPTESLNEKTLKELLVSLAERSVAGLELTPPKVDSRVDLSRLRSCHAELEALAVRVAGGEHVSLRCHCRGRQCTSRHASAK